LVDFAGVVDLVAQPGHAGIRSHDCIALVKLFADIGQLRVASLVVDISQDNESADKNEAQDELGCDGEKPKTDPLGSHPLLGLLKLGT
jgi:hypothetical protein